MDLIDLFTTVPKFISQKDEKKLRRSCHTYIKIQKFLMHYPNICIYFFDNNKQTPLVRTERRKEIPLDHKVWIIQILFM